MHDITYFTEFTGCFSKRDFSSSPLFCSMTTEELNAFNTAADRENGDITFHDAESSNGCFYITIKYGTRHYRIMQRPDGTWMMPMYGIRLFSLSPSAYGPLLDAPVAASGVMVEDGLRKSVTWFSFASRQEVDAALDELIDKYSLVPSDAGSEFMNDEWYVRLGNTHFIPDWSLAKVIVKKKTEVWGARVVTYSILGFVACHMNVMRKEFNTMNEEQRNEFYNYVQKNLKSTLDDRLVGDIKSGFTDDGYFLSFMMKHDWKSPDSHVISIRFSIDREGIWHRNVDSCV